MIKEFVFCVGLPGCGKSTYIKSNYEDVTHICSREHVVEKTIEEYINLYIKSGNVIISADEIKEYLDGYHPEHPEFVHEESVRVAKQHIYNIVNNCKNFDGRIILDGGGINGHYNLEIIDFFMKNSPDTKITCLYFDTPVEVCIERISKRERKVPISEIYKKNQKLIGCLNKYKEVVDSIITINYFKNKYVILDMDGTIASYNKTIVDEDGNVDFVNGLHFKNSRPVKSIINYVKDHFDMTNVYIITACPNSIAWQEKNTWIDKYFPEVHIMNRFFVGNKDWKHVFIKHLALKNKWKMNEICVIDDFHSTLQKCAKLGMNTVHPSNIESL